MFIHFYVLICTAAIHRPSAFTGNSFPAPMWSGTATPVIIPIKNQEPVFAMNEVQQKPASKSFFGRGAGKPIFAKNDFPAHMLNQKHLLIKPIFILFLISFFSYLTRLFRYSIKH
jgi:hypothetical protein